MGCGSSRVEPLAPVLGPVASQAEQQAAAERAATENQGQKQAAVEQAATEDQAEKQAAE